MSKHTPGPWYYSECGANEFFIVTEDPSQHDDRGWGRMIGEVDGLSDARLIAQSPELLKVAKLMRDRLTYLANIADCCWNDWEYSYLVDDVIAKAEGQEVPHA